MSKIKNRFLRLVLRWLLIFLSVFVTLLLVITLLFKFFKNDIAKELLRNVNTMQNGEIAFDDISINPFVHFPNVSLSINSVVYYEFPSAYRATDSIPIFELDKIFIAFDIIELIDGNISVSDVLLKNGNLRLITKADSSLNIIDALGIETDTNQTSRDTLQELNSDFDLNLEVVKLRNINISYTQTQKNNYSNFYINSVDASLSYSSDSILCSITSNITVTEIRLSDKFLLENKLLNLSTSIIYDRNSSRLVVNPSKFSFDRANFATKGYVDFSGDGFIDMEVSGGDKDLSILNLFLKNTIVDGIKKGDLQFKGTIKGGLSIGIPEIEFSFGIVDVEIEIPKTKQTISQLGLSGYFESGVDADFSGAYLEIKNIEAKLPGGNLYGRISVRDFRNPVFEIYYDMKTNLDGFEEIFNFTSLDSIVGNLEVTSSLSGEYDIHHKQVVNKKGSSSIRCNNISFVVPGVNRVKDLNAVITFDADSLYIDKLELDIGTSDFKISGYLTNLMYLLFDLDKNIEGELSIVSNTYDFPDFFSYNPRVANSFPFKFKDIGINVDISTSTTKLLDFRIVPNIDFNILHLDAIIEDFLPPITINSGLFNISEIDTSLNLDFSNFDITMAGSQLMANVVYNSPRVNPDCLTVDVDVSDLNPQTAFVNWFADSIPDLLNGNLFGKFNLNLVFSLDTLDFDTLNFTANSFSFKNITDTLDINQIKLNAVDIDYSLSSSVNIMETLNCEFDFSISEFNSNSFKVNELDFNIDVKKGVYYVHPKSYQFLTGKGDGLFILKPFEVKPTFELKYNIKQFDVAELFSIFMEDTLISGNMDLDFDFTFTGTNRKEIEQSLNGKLLLRGTDLTLYGLDLDKVIDRFKRSQQFTLADVGAVVLMGPAGILLTKGSDYASLIVLNPGESCRVVELSSDWEIEGGIVSLSDVAFTTQQNRLAAKGWINLLTDSLSIDIALLNEKGCSIYSQSVLGDIGKPHMGKVKVVKSLLAPVTNLVSNVGEMKCDVFYDGKVKQPEEK